VSLQQTRPDNAEVKIEVEFYLTPHENNNQTWVIIQHSGAISNWTAKEGKYKYPR